MSGPQRRALRNVLLAAGAIAAWTVGAAFIPGLRGRVGGLWIVLPVFLLLPFLHVLIFRLNSAVDSAVDRLKAANFKVCTRCRYDLSKHADAGTCPECGGAYTREELERAWRKMYPMHL